MSFFKEYMLPAFIGGGTAWAIIKYLSKKFIEQQLQKDIENHKSQLTEKTEALKHSLSIYAHERNVKASRVDHQLSSALKKVYSEFAQLLNYAEKFSNESPPQVCPDDLMDEKDSQKACDYRFYKENAEKIENHSERLKESLLINAIYISQETYDIIHNIQNDFMKLANEFLAPIRDEENGNGDIEEIVDDLLELKNKLAAYFNEDLSKSKDIIFSTFRKQLGVEKI